VNRTFMEKEAKKASKVEQKVSILMKGYENRSHVLRKQIGEAYKQLGSSIIEYESFRGLHQLEALAIPSRIEVLFLDFFKTSNFFYLLFH